MSVWRDCSTHTCAYSIQRNPIWKIIGLIALFLTVLSIVIALTVHFTGGNSDSPLEKAEKLLAEIILFDGHNDFASNVLEIVSNDLTRFNFSQDLSELPEWSRTGFVRTDLLRLKLGLVKSQFWVARAECESQYKDATEITLEQIDVIKRLIANYSEDMQLATSAQEVRDAVDENKIASLIAVGGGHSINWSLAILRIYYELGVRYLSLTEAYCSTPWADAAIADRVPRPRQMHEGLSAFGEDVIAELNRLGMIIDLSHTSIATMKAVLIVSKAPVIFSNSNARELCNNEKNVRDEILKLVKQTDGLVMVNFVPSLLRCDDSNTIFNTTVADVVAHLDYLKSKMSADNIGLGSSFDGTESIPEGLEDVSKFPNLFAALIASGGWTESDMEKLAGRNLLRVMEEVERVRDSLAEAGVGPGQNWIRRSDLKRMMNFTVGCTTTKLSDPTNQGRYSRSSNLH